MYIKNCHCKTSFLYIGNINNAEYPAEHTRKDSSSLESFLTIKFLIIKKAYFFPSAFALFLAFAVSPTSKSP